MAQPSPRPPLTLLMNTGERWSLVFCSPCILMHSLSVSSRLVFLPASRVKSCTLISVPKSPLTLEISGFFRYNKKVYMKSPKGLLATLAHCTFHLITQLCSSRCLHQPFLSASPAHVDKPPRH